MCQSEALVVMQHWDYCLWILSTCMFSTVCVCRCDLLWKKQEHEHVTLAHVTHCVTACCFLSYTRHSGDIQVQAQIKALFFSLQHYENVLSVNRNLTLKDFAIILCHYTGVLFYSSNESSQSGKYFKWLQDSFQLAEENNKFHNKRQYSRLIKILLPQQDIPSSINHCTDLCIPISWAAYCSSSALFRAWLFVYIFAHTRSCWLCLFRILNPATAVPISRDRLERLEPQCFSLAFLINRQSGHVRLSSSSHKNKTKFVN